MPVERSVSAGPVRHFGFIDALRGWAFLGVLITHASNEAAPGALLGHITWRGPFGVQLFFVLSALTLFLSMESRRGRDKRPLAAFFIRRFFRVAPMFWLALIFYMVAWGTGPNYWAPDGITANMIAATACFVHGWRPEYINSVVPGGWSIVVEMGFYALLPLLFLSIRSLRQAAGFWCVALVFGVALRHWLLPVIASHYPPAESKLVLAFLYLWLPSQLSVFAIGIVAYFLLKEKLRPGGAHGRTFALLRRPGFLLGASFVFGGAVAPLLKTEWLPTQDIFAISFGLLACGLASWPVALLVNPVTRYAGKVSYSAYLTHFALLHPLQLLIERTHGPFAKGSALDFILLVGSAFVLTLAISTITHHLIEIPGQELGKRLIRFLDEPVPAFTKPENEPVS